MTGRHAGSRPGRARAGSPVPRQREPAALGRRRRPAGIRRRPGAHARPGGRFPGILLVIALSAFMTTLDNTVVNVALPSIQRDLHVSLNVLEWIATSFILAFASLLLPAGRLADVLGGRRVLLTGMAVFTAASLLAGLAWSAPVLLAARVVQGVGSALVLPAGLAVITVGRSDRERAAGTSTWMAASALALALGPVTGGFLVAHWHWGTIFLINVPTGIAILVLGLVTLPAGAPAHPSGAGGFDVPGAIGAGVLLSALTYALLQGPEHGWLAPGTATALVVALACLVALVAVERRCAAPLFDASLYRTRAFTGGMAIQVLWGIGFNGVLFYAAIFLQDVLLFSPPKAGAAFLPPAIVIAVLAPLSFRAVDRFGARGTVGGGLLLMAGGMLLFTLLRRGDGYAALLPGVLLLGVGTGLITPLTKAILESLPEHRSGTAGSFLSLGREISGALGIAVIGAVIAGRHGADSVREAPEEFRSALVTGLVVGAALVALGALVSRLTLPGRAASAGSPERAPAWSPDDLGRRAEPREGTPAPRPTTIGEPAP